MDLEIRGRRLLSPCVTAVIDRILPDADLQALQQKGLRAVELRFDLFTADFAEAAAFARRVRETFLVIGTLRETDKNRAVLAERYSSLSPLSDIVDIEIGTSPRERADFIKIVKQAGARLMLSHHDFERVPAESDLEAFLEDASALGADFTKLALFARDRTDAARLMGFLEKCRAAGKTGLTAFAMGPEGAVTRVSAALHGSIFTYGFIHNQAAPGQLSVGELLDLCNKFFPG